MRGLAFVLLLAGCPKAEPLVTPEPGPAPVAGQVCCESFGYGAMMVKCCESYAWTAPEACVTPEGFVGGGKAVVADEMCAAK